MSQEDEPFDSGGRTIIRASRRPVSDAPEPNWQAVSSPNATIVFSGSAPVPSGLSATVFYENAPFPVRPEAKVEGPQPPGHPEAMVDQDAIVDAARHSVRTAANPFIAAASPILLLLSRLRITPVRIDIETLADEIGVEIERFASTASSPSIDPKDARIAKFALCETCDDIILNLPGISAEAWARLGMTRRFFKADFTGTGFFEALNTILADPERHADLLELMHACLSLGFAGQYRQIPNGEAALARVRQDVYETLRFFRSRPSSDLSPRWQGLSAASVQVKRRIPLWAIAAAAFAVVVGSFFLMRSLVTSEGDALAGELAALNPAAPVAIQRASFAPLVEEKPETPAMIAQIDRIRAALSQEIQSGGLSVETKGDFIVVEIDNQLLFPSGSATLKPEFGPIGERVSAALAPEKGGIKIVGHTDNVKPRKSGSFKSNYDLSVARAKAVQSALAATIGDPNRLDVEGKGDEEPIADNATPEGRAKNRRIDVMLRREESL